MNFTTIENAIRTAIVATTGIDDEKVLWARQLVQRPTGLWASLGPFNIRPTGRDWLRTEDNILSLVADTIESVDTVNDQVTVTSHLYQTGDGPLQLTTDGALPAGLSLLKDYWIVVDDADTISFADTFPKSVAASPTLVDITTVGSGTHTISASTSSTARAGAEVNRLARGRRTFELTVQCYGADATGSARPSSVLNDLVAKVMLPSNYSGLVAAGISISRFSDVQEFELFLGQEVESRGLLTILGHLAEEVSETGTYIETSVPAADPPL